MVVTPNRRRVPWARKPRKDHLGASLAASLALHALILSLQFGVSGLGLSLPGTSRTERRASIPTLQAILREQKQPSVAEVKPQPLVTAENEVAKVRVQPRKAGKSQFHAPVAPTQVESRIVADKAMPAKDLTAPSEAEQPKVATQSPELTQVPVVDQGVSVLATDKESSWAASVAAAAPEVEGKARNERIELERANEVEALERNRMEQAENQRKAELAAIAKAAAEALERRRIEEGNRAAEQAALAKARLEAVEQARIEEEKRKAEQAAIVKAAGEALAKKAEALARTEQLAAQSAQAAEAKKQQDDRAANTILSLAGKAEGVTGQQADMGGSLASRALDQARNSLRGFPISQPPPSDRQRRGSILGRDPKEIQLAFYGEGWRQKVERIGSLNYPKISKNRHYDPLVVTVSINSDGTLAAVRIDKSSGHKEVDDAVRRIVEMSAPFAAFPPDLKNSYDVVDITRTWNFLEERPRIYTQ